MKSSFWGLPSKLCMQKGIQIFFFLVVWFLLGLNFKTILCLKKMVFILCLSINCFPCRYLLRVPATTSIWTQSTSVMLPTPSVLTVQVSWTLLSTSHINFSGKNSSSSLSSCMMNTSNQDSSRYGKTALWSVCFYQINIKHGNCIAA